MQFSFTHEIVFEETGFFSSAITIPSWLGSCFVREIFSMDVTTDSCGSQICLMFVNKISSITGDLDH